MSNNVFKYSGPMPQVWVDVGAGKSIGMGVEFGDNLHGTIMTTPDSSNMATVRLHCLFIAEYSVKGEDNVGDAAISQYDSLYWDDANDYLNADATNNKLFGVAWSAGVSSGATTTIEVAVLAN